MKAGSTIRQLITIYLQSFSKTKIEDVDNILESDGGLSNIGGKDHLPLIRSYILESQPKIST